MKTSLNATRLSQSKPYRRDLPAFVVVAFVFSTTTNANTRKQKHRLPKRACHRPEGLLSQKKTTIATAHPQTPAEVAMDFLAGAAKSHLAHLVHYFDTMAHTERAPLLVSLSSRRSQARRVDAEPFVPLGTPEKSDNKHNPDKIANEQKQCGSVNNAADLQMCSARAWRRPRTSNRKKRRRCIAKRCN